MPSFLLPCITEGAAGVTGGRRLGLGKKEVMVRIDSSVVSMESSRRYTSVTAKSASASTVRRTGGPKEDLESLFGDLIDSGENAEQTGESEENPAELEDISAHFKNMSRPGRVSMRQRPQDAVTTIRQYCMRFLMELLFGFGRNDRDPWNTGAAQPGEGFDQRVYQAGFVTNSYYHMEQERTSFSTTGVVKTADGRELSFNLECSMSRRFEEYYEETYSTGIKYCDPLVINLDTDVASVSDQKFYFDLDQDGTAEEISSLASGSGFLALDLNGDGVINDGGELFGTKSGDGFADLARYDADGNGWIDEADEIWNKLQIWTRDEAGNDILYHLSDLGVGAIGLGSVSTEFSLNAVQDNQTNALIRRTGIFLYENGTVSTVQHLDMAQHLDVAQ